MVVRIDGSGQVSISQAGMKSGRPQGRGCSDLTISKCISTAAVHIKCHQAPGSPGVYKKPAILPVTGLPLGNLEICACVY